MCACLVVRGVPAVQVGAEGMDGIRVIRCLRMIKLLRIARCALRGEGRGVVPRVAQKWCIF